MSAPTDSDKDIPLRSCGRLHEDCNWPKTSEGSPTTPMAGHFSISIHTISSRGGEARITDHATLTLSLGA